MQQYSEKQLIEGCRDNQRHFQEILYKQYFPKMMAMCMHHTNGNQADAMDMLNAGFLKVFQKIGTFEFKGSFEGWIRRIVYHAIVDHYKQNAKHSHFLVLEEKDDKVESSGLQNCYVEDLMQLLEYLPPTTQKVFKLYALEGFSHKEIGETLNMSDGTSKWHLSTAREKLKKLLQEQYFLKVN
jgi:RNA polymerase sigma factor (sigma-70 family)